VQTRRRFLGQAGAAALAAAGFGRQDRRPLLVGSGSYRFDCIHDWLTPPDGLLFGDTHGLAQDKAGRIYVAHTVHPDSTSRDAVCVFGPDGRFLQSWGARFDGGAHGLDIREEDGTEYLYHCDTKARSVVKTKLDGTVVWEHGAPQESGKYGDGAPFVPTNVAFRPDGGLWVADGYGSNWIHELRADGSYVRTFGGPGSEAGQLVQPHGLWLDDRGAEPSLLVADRGNRRLQRFDLDGKHVSFHKEGVRLPCHLKFREGDALVPDLESVVTILDAEGQPVASLGDGHPSGLRGRPRSEFVPGKFIHPHSAIWLHSGDILVAEWVPIGRVTLLKQIPS
jgi:hypothetical protein